MFGRRVAEQYEARIAELKAAHSVQISILHSQISDLRKLAYNATSATHIPLVALEADAVMSQKEETITISREELERISEEQSEADRILAGNY